MQSVIAGLLGAFFSTEDPAVLAAVRDDLVEVELPAGGVLFREGDHTAEVYFVIRGRLRALVAGVSGAMRHARAARGSAARLEKIRSGGRGGCAGGA